MNQPRFEHRKAVAEPNLEVGEAVGWLLLTYAEWAHRRVDSRQFLGEARGRRQVSTDFSVQLLPPVDFSSLERIWPGRIVVPLAVLKKAPLFGFDLRDESGNSVPILTADENVWVSSSVLVAVAQAEIEDELTPDEIEAIVQIASSTANQAQANLSCLSSHTRLLSLMEEPSLFELWASDFARNFLLLALVDPLKAPRRIFKYSHEVDLSSRSLRFPLLSRLGWSEVHLDVSIPRLDCRSYHVELESPDGLQIVADPAISIAGPGQPSPNWVTDSARTPSMAHAHLSAGVSVSDPHGGPLSIAPPQANLQFNLLPSARGLVRGAMVVAWLVVILTLLGFLNPEELGRAQSQADAPSALLLAVIGGISLFIARPGEHVFVSRLLLPLRLVLAVVGGLVPYVAAFTLVVKAFDLAALRFWWGVLFVLSLLGAVLLTKVYDRAWQAKGL